VAGAQRGAISRAQLRAAGVVDATISRWFAEGYIHRHLPGVYTVGHDSLSVEGRLNAALLYAGDGAVLSHATAAWWWGLMDAEPRIVHVSTSARRVPQRDLRIHGRRAAETTTHRRLPVTTVAQTLLDFASQATVNQVRKALAEADYRRILDPRAIDRILRRGAPGSSVLRRALDQHQPQLAHTRSELERRFLDLCAGAELPLPAVNVKLSGLTVDAVWRAEKVIVELDGSQGHSTPAQMQRDRDRDLKLRAAGYVVLRYTWAQITQRPHEVVADLQRVLSRFAPSA